MNQTPKDVQVKHTFRASANRVYSAWLDPSLAGQFLFATENGEMVRVELDAREGGAFTFIDRRDGEDILHTGTYLELTPPTRIRFRFAVPKYSEHYTEVTVDISPAGTGCIVTLVQKDTPSEYEERTVHGWSTILQKADRVLAEPPANREASGTH